ncbi:hypothetical protein COW94_04275 [Candidatus Peregrinibacteria bacterium CG22_combo_CG10-13_8_21_14_all_44_10]|nr:MAG: hypothetical protein AUK45_04255 [Candidatus Peregrinibacteria bacterium CG2_30_44_17]PIP65968.1 MAG: hypothetical protein COW94_04275 [Candidatus Peregrinibacteria bacterium CG22_combo_CG10-13_8_21_14_all_44_10]PIS04533.1 MAG: hypothetical protein COT83_00065 [Candidatus Peregrinibacteria bacterium CG10_big_fil_rev_8_21_14_0_10_44_7]PIX79106.1 MAG: hypothetical protein COZ35_04105 [Candidatus Peregrinibacteria bacterium CG_4_10_14_3_um_filter_44_21]PJB89582.1 MAG: hypothetical protein 
MEIIPSIYLQEGKIVSWYKGKQNDQKKTYYKEPLHMARFFASEGAIKLQIIDLGGTLSGSLQHTKMIKKICSGIKSEVQLGGGIRTMEEVERAFELGATRVLLGVSSIKILKEALTKYGPNKIIMGIKGNYNKVDTDFTLDGGVPEVTDLAKQIQKVGVTQLIYKDMQTEGAMYHPNFDMIEKIIYETDGKMDIYSSGGTADEYDLKLLRETGTKGVIIGRAFMENALDFRKLREMYEG